MNKTTEMLIADNKALRTRVEELEDALSRAERLLEITDFSAPEDLNDLQIIAAAMRGGGENDG